MSAAPRFESVASLTDRIRTAVGMPSRTQRAVYRLVEELPITPVDEVRPGLHPIRGTVVADDTVPEPMTPEQCVYAQYELRERVQGRASNVQYAVAEGRVDAVPFRVEDETGSVLVDPTGIVHPGDGRADSPLDAAGPQPLSDGATGAFAESGDEFERLERQRLGREETDAALIHREVHVQSTIRPGDTVYVLGEFERRAGSYAVEPGEGPFLLSDMSRSALATALERRSGDVSGQFLRFVAFGLIAVSLVALVLGLAVAIVVSFLGT
jgi:hypothetical protein